MARQEGFAFPAGKATAVATCHRHVPKSRLSSHESAIKKWLGRLDSNQRMEESKSSALPLGYAPMSRRQKTPVAQNFTKIQTWMWPHPPFRSGASDGNRTRHLSWDG